MLSAIVLATLLAAPEVEARPGATPVEDAVLAGVPADVARELAARAEARGVAPEAALAPAVNAARAGVPAGPVAAKILEGLAKGVAADRVLAVASALADRLGRATALLDEARGAGLSSDPASRPAALADLADALAAGVPPDAVRALVQAARTSGVRRCDSVIGAARTLGELARRGVPVVDALPLAAALATRPPLPAGEVAVVYDAYRREGGEAPGPFLREARRRAARGETLDGLVDPFGETPDHVNASRDGKPATLPTVERGRGSGRAEPGAVPGLEGEPRGRGKGRTK